VSRRAAKNIWSAFPGEMDNDMWAELTDLPRGLAVCREVASNQWRSATRAAEAADGEALESLHNLPS